MYHASTILCQCIKLCTEETTHAACISQHSVWKPQNGTTASTSFVSGAVVVLLQAVISGHLDIGADPRKHLSSV